MIVIQSKYMELFEPWSQKRIKKTDLLQLLLIIIFIVFSIIDLGSINGILRIIDFKNKNQIISFAIGCIELIIRLSFIILMNYYILTWRNYIKSH